MKDIIFGAISIVLVCIGGVLIAAQVEDQDTLSAIMTGGIIGCGTGIFIAGIATAMYYKEEDHE